MTPMYLRLNVMLLKFVFICATLFFNISYLANFAREKWRNEVAKILRVFVVLLLNLVYICAKAASPESMLINLDSSLE